MSDDPRRVWQVLPHPTDLVGLLHAHPRCDVALLDTPRPGHGHRWSFLCVDATHTISVEGPRPRDVFSELERVLTARTDSLPPGPDTPPFAGGYVGWLGYELLHLLEDVPLTPSARTDLPPLAALSRFDTVVAVDHLRSRTWVVCTGRSAGTHSALQAASDLLAIRLPEIRACAGAADSAGPAPLQTRLTGDTALAHMPSELGPREYRALVRRLRDEIRAGEAFEVCLTRRHRLQSRVSGTELFSILRHVSPNPMSAYVRIGRTEVVSSSPERFLRLDRDRWVETRPIKGTRPRGANPVEDRRFHDELAGSEKDRAENLMIVDLARNDLGRVCELGSVEVPELCTVESHAHTHQMVSTVRGRLRDTVSPVECIRAAFPPGSMTGAPKIAAMRFIAEVEPVPRRIYAGALGWLDSGGTFDLSVVIRAFTLYAGLVDFHVGGAVVAESVPEAEFQETLDKARGLVTAFEIAARRRGASRSAAELS